CRIVICDAAIVATIAADEFTVTTNSTRENEGVPDQSDGKDSRKNRLKPICIPRRCPWSQTNKSCKILTICCRTDSKCLLGLYGSLGIELNECIRICQRFSETVIVRQKCRLSSFEEESINFVSLCEISQFRPVPSGIL